MSKESQAQENLKPFTSYDHQGKQLLRIFLMFESVWALLYISQH